jgi:2-oxoisovalerate dehydrogenase E1 component
VYQEVPEDYYSLPLGEAALLRSGDDLSIISYGAGVHWALEAADKLGLSADVIDLRTLQPLDTDCLYRSVQKTGKVLILQEDTLFGGMASELAALITEHCFTYLDAPVRRLGSMETPVPFAANLEALYLPKERLEKALQELRDY